MTLPAAATKVYMDSSSDDPKLARAELADLVDKFNALLTHCGLSTILSTPLTVGSNLENSSGALHVKAASTTQDGAVELATDAEAIAKTDTVRALTPANLAALGGSATFAGLLELATDAEALTGTDTQRAITPANLAYVLASLSGSIVQSAYEEYTSNADLSTSIPADDTIPQNTEGTQIISKSFTPKKSTNKIRLRFRGSVQAASGTTQNIACALFKDSAADAIAVDSIVTTAAADRFSFNVTHEFTLASASAFTIAVRVGNSLGTAVRLNGTVSGRLYGGKMKATLEIEEISV